MKSLMLDARWLDSGLGAYTLNLIRGLGQTEEFQTRLLTMPRHAQTLASFGFDVSLLDTPIYSLQEQWQVLLRAGQSDVLHVPHYNAPLLRRGCLLVTIHDLHHITDEVQRRRPASWLYAQPMLRMVARRADHIFTVSEYSRQRISELLGADPERISVVHNGVSPHIFPEDREEARRLTQQRLGCDAPYLLFVGNLKPNKNVAGLLRAFAVLLQGRRLPHRLLVIGDDAIYRPVLQTLARELGIADRVLFAGRVPDDDLRHAYNGAEAVVLPSFDEGFGIPVIEAMACGTPVACSAAAALPEVAGDAAEYFDPTQPDSMVASLEKVLTDSSLRSLLRERGLQRAALFSWAHCAARHLEVYRKYLCN